MKIAFFDMDGTILAPTFWKDGRLVPGLTAGEWIEHCDDHPDSAFEDCPVVHQTVAFAAKLAAHGYDLKILSRTTPESERAAKTAWLRNRRLDGTFSEVIFVNDDALKMAYLRDYVERTGIDPADVLLVEDCYANVMHAVELGIHPIHVTNITTGFAEAMAGLT